MSKKIGRPIKWTQEYIQKIDDMLNEYINESQYPIVEKFCYDNNIRRQTLYEKDEFSDTLKRLNEKRSFFLEMGGLSGELNTTMVIFALKQRGIGWTDKPHQDNSDKLIEKMDELIRGIDAEME